MIHYKLDGKNVVPTDDIGIAFTQDRTVAKDTIKDILISTVFLGINHGYNGEVLLFETILGKLGSEEKKPNIFNEPLSRLIPSRRLLFVIKVELPSTSRYVTSGIDSAASGISS